MYELLKTEFRKEPVQSVRREGFIPGVIFGKGIESINFQVPTAQFRNFYKHSGKVFQIEVAGHGKHLINVDDVQWDAFHSHLLHLSFHKIEENVETIITLPIHLIGTPVGTKEGGVVNQVIHEVEVKGLPKDMPEFLEFDITELTFDSHFTLKDFTLPQGLTFDHDIESNVVSCHPAKVYKEPEVEVEEVIEDAAVTAEGETPTEETTDEKQAS